jgi:hypothetical protein
MDNKERTDFIIRHLSQGNDPNDLIYQICQKDNIPWSQAEELVKRVRVEKADVIVKKQFPLLFVIALAIFLSGLVLIGYSTFLSVEEISFLQGSPRSQGAIHMDGLQILTVFIVAILDKGPTPVLLLIFGIAMILGSLVGMRDAWSSMLNR